MTDRKSRIAAPISQVVLLLLGILIIYLVVDFGRQVLVSHQRQAELRQVEARIDAAMEDGVALEERLAYAQSPQAAEAWARNQGWAKSNEVPVIVVAPEGEAANSPRARREEGLRLGSVRQTWWDLFFGDR
ncbi:hypothetical protein ACFLWA_11685 [Chloroflexota bacterium]